MGYVSQMCVTFICKRMCTFFVEKTFPKCQKGKKRLKNKIKELHVEGWITNFFPS